MDHHERRRHLLTLIHELGSQSPAALARHFHVSVQTIRADIRTLSERGLVLRRQGEVLPFPGRENDDFERRAIINIDGKRRIAALAQELIEDHQVLFLGTGTTVEQVALRLGVHQDLQVITNNLHAAMALCHQSCEVVVCGGRIRRRDKDVIGGDAWRFFQRYRADVGIVSVGGMDDDGRLYDYNDDEVMAREALFAHATRRVLVLDRTKFATRLCCTAGRLDDFDAVITDQALPDQLRSPLAARGVRFLSA